MQVLLLILLFPYIFLGDVRLKPGKLLLDIIGDGEEVLEDDDVDAAVDWCGVELKKDGGGGGGGVDIVDDNDDDIR